MVFSMAMGMSIGLFLGTLCGILYQGQLVLSMVLGIGGGVIAGTTIGSYFSFLALMEGMLSGVMAGMMGAMLGEMAKPGDWDTLIMVIFTISISICFLITYEIINYMKNPHIWIRMYQHPIIMGLIFAFLLRRKVEWYFQWQWE